MTLLLETPAATAPPAARRRRPWTVRVLAAVMVVAGLTASLVVAAPRLASFDDVTPRAVGAPYVTVPEYGPKGAYILGYVHDAKVQLTLPIRNTGRLPVTITSLDLGGGPAPLLAVRGAAGLPVTVWPGRSADVTVEAVLSNCRYYHERALETFVGATVGFSSLGREGVRVVTFDRPIMIKGPMLVGCPGRKLDRSAENRSDLR